MLLRPNRAPFLVILDLDRINHGSMDNNHLPYPCECAIIPWASPRPSPRPNQYRPFVICTLEKTLKKHRFSSKTMISTAEHLKISLIIVTIFRLRRKKRIFPRRSAPYDHNGLTGWFYSVGIGFQCDILKKWSFFWRFLYSN